MRDPYLYDDVDVLINLANIKESKKLREFEGSMAECAISSLYQSQPQKFDVELLQSIHRDIFGQVYDWAGEFRTIPIAKSEEVLGGDTVRYSMPGEIAKHLKEIFAQIRTVKRTGDNDEDVVFRLVRIIARIWHIHPFREGNTRTTVIFAVLWARYLGFDVDHALLKENAAYVRNALVWGSQGIYSKFEYLDTIFRDAILHIDDEVEPQTQTQGKYEKIGDYRVKDYKEQPHHYLDEDKKK